MSVQDGPDMTAFIERICDAHRDRDRDGPLLTLVEGAWAYCAGHGDERHEWRIIEPAPRQMVEEKFASP